MRSNAAGIDALHRCPTITHNRATMDYTAGIYTDQQGRKRWGVLLTNGAWIFPSMTGKRAAVALANRLEREIPREPKATLLRRFNVYYLNTRTVIEATHEGEAESIAAQRWNTTTKAVKAFAKY